MKTNEIILAILTRVPNATLSANSGWQYLESDGKKIYISAPIRDDGSRPDKTFPKVEASGWDPKVGSPKPGRAGHVKRVLKVGAFKNGQPVSEKDFPVLIAKMVESFATAGHGTCDSRGGSSAPTLDIEAIRAALNTK